MGKMLTQEQFEQRIYESVEDKYTVIGTYQGQRNPVTLFCNRHKIEFSIIAGNLMRGSNDIRAICPSCKKDEQKERFKDFNADVTCAYCGKIFQMKKVDQIIQKVDYISVVENIKIQLNLLNQAQNLI